MPAMVASQGSELSSQVPLCQSAASAKNISFEMKPFSSGTPAIAAEATMANAPVTGMKRISPLRRRMSRVPVSWSMMPAAMNRLALNTAWFTMWKIAAMIAPFEPMPASAVMRPR
jgi:hypothetical protein